MNTSDKIINTPSTDPFDRLIFEKGLRVKHLLFDKEINLMLVVLNSAQVLKLKLSDYPKLNQATDIQLNNWKLVSGGVAIEWEELDEDLSLKGFIQQAAFRARQRRSKQPCSIVRYVLKIADVNGFCGHAPLTRL